LKVQIGEEQVQVGSVRFIEREEIVVPSAIRQAEERSWMAEHSLILVAVDGRVAGAIELEIGVRAEAKAVVDALRHYKQIRSLVVVSGDQVAPTAALAQSLGIHEYVAKALPSDKAALIAKLQAEGCTVCFMGDGINDAVALKQANLSISIHGATTAAVETAHIVLMESDLRQLLSLFEMAQEYEANQRKLTAAVLSPGIIGALGVYFFGFGLQLMTLLDLLDGVMGTAIAMQPWWRQRQMSNSADEKGNSAT
jgi:Cu2+-exporting ATPase